MRLQVAVLNASTSGEINAEPRRQRLLDRHGAFSVDCREVFAKRGLGMIKKIGSYPELTDPQLQPRYSGIPTFFRLPHSVRLDEVDIGLVGVPFDGGVTNRPGARHGPRPVWERPPGS